MELQESIQVRCVPPTFVVRAGGKVYIPLPRYPTAWITYPLDTLPQIPYAQIYPLDNLSSPDTLPPGYFTPDTLCPDALSRDIPLWNTLPPILYSLRYPPRYPPQIPNPWLPHSPDTLPPQIYLPGITYPPWNTLPPDTLPHTLTPR